MTVNTFRSAASPARGADGTDRVTGRTAFTQSIARRILWKLAIRVAIVILAMTGTAYDPVFPLVTEKSLEQHGGGIEFGRAVRARRRREAVMNALTEKGSEHPRRPRRVGSRDPVMLP